MDGTEDGQRPLTLKTENVLTGSQADFVVVDFEEALSDKVASETEMVLESGLDSVVLGRNVEFGIATLLFLCPSPRTTLS